MAAALKTLAFWLPLFLLGMALHESLHGVAVLLLGSHPELVLRPWPLALAPVSIPGVHVAAVPPLDATRQAIDNLAGPGTAALVFLAATARTRGRPLRAALAANAAGLAFFAVIEPAYVFVDADFLTAPEFNYGIPLAFALAAALWAGSAPVGREDAGRRDQRRHQQDQHRHQRA